MFGKICADKNLTKQENTTIHIICHVPHLSGTCKGKMWKRTPTLLLLVPMYIVGVYTVWDIIV